MLVASSQTSLRQMAGQGLLLPDLAFRLTAVRFIIPPLRQRREDIAPLAQALLDRICARYQQRPFRSAPAAMARLLQHNWPGNVRELASVLEAALLESVNGVIRAEDLSLLSAPLPHLIHPADPFENLSLDAVIRHHVQYVLEPESRQQAPRRPPTSASAAPPSTASSPPPRPSTSDPLFPTPCPLPTVHCALSTVAYSLLPVPCLFLYTRHDGVFPPTSSQGPAALKTLALQSLAVLLLAPAFLPAQHLTASSAPTSLEDRRKALNNLFHDYWEASLERFPEFASDIGDNRYNDKISDRSVKAINEWLATQQNLLLKLAAIDPTGLSDQEKTSREILMHDLADSEEGAEFKEWEMPVNQMGGIYSEYPQLVAAAQLQNRQGLRRLDRPPPRHSQGLRSGHHQHVHRHRRSSRPAQIPPRENP